MAKDNMDRSLGGPQVKFPRESQCVFSYTRQKAIADGVLVDLSRYEVTRQHYKWPIACTSGVWAIIQEAVNSEKEANDIEGVLHDILWLSTLKVRAMRSTGRNIVFFDVVIKGTSSKSDKHTFKLHFGPGDDREPVITLMLSDED